METLNSQASRALYSSSWDAYLISVLFGIMGITNVFMVGGALMGLFGGFQIVLSFISAMQGTERRKLAKQLEES